MDERASAESVYGGGDPSDECAREYYVGIGRRLGGKKLAEGRCICLEPREREKERCAPRQSDK